MRRENTHHWGVGQTVLNYIIRDGETKKWVEKMKAGGKIDWDYQLMEIIIRGRRKEREKQGGMEKFWREIWDKEEKMEFRDKLENVERCGKKWKQEGKK